MQPLTEMQQMFQENNCTLQSFATNLGLPSPVGQRFPHGILHGHGVDRAVSSSGSTRIPFFTARQCWQREMDVQEETSPVTDPVLLLRPPWRAGPPRQS